ncbi:MAG: 3-ketoacyl-(acyl-carrier-protein) reductase [Euryarchaeota archaeon ADurb.BinA087]|nr:MAG: 3-ketoacyl-(acyl-carrier-protein) reductase [Euryarchaeota archaeon ADurb.BinA087]HPX73580.1 SDR family oxidoreductase [Methanoregulaceae archaeon]
MDNNGYYQDKISIVTGGNSGIGYALCEELLKRGGTVYLAGRDQKKVAEAAGQLSAFRDRVRTLIVDVTKQEQVQKAIERTAKEAGRLDMLFNNAGIFKPMLFETGTLDDWRAMIDTNLWSVIYGVQAAIPIMLRQGSGHIVNTSSLAGLVPYPMQVIYDTTKYAVVGLSESLRYEYAEKGIRVSVICPGDIATPVFSKIVDSKGQGAPIPPEAYPVDKAASYILDHVAEGDGRIIVPYEPNHLIYGGYILGDKKVEEFLLKHAHDHRIRFEKEGRFI